MDIKSNPKLGEGAYGGVYLRNGNAVKQFDGLRHIIQEYTALKYLSDCDYIVKVKDVSFADLQLDMELYDSNLKTWLSENKKDKNYYVSINKIIHDILCGLIELHDRGLCHGDLKPGNVLIRKNPLKAVLGDCGFVCISKYTKTHLTTKTYRDPFNEKIPAHDMFSFGICLYELIIGKRIPRKETYQEYEKVVDKYVVDSSYKKIITSLLHSDKTKRPTSRDVLVILFEENPNNWVSLNFYKNNNQISKKETESIRDIIKVIGHQYKINRCNQGYIAILNYLNEHGVYPEFYHVYGMVTLTILSSIFGRTGYNEEKCINSCKGYKNISIASFHDIIKELLSDNKFVSTLLQK